jgi:molybdate transport system permease protein
MGFRGTRSPLTWLGGLLALYLAVPLVAFLVRFAGSDDRGTGVPGLWDAVRVSVVAASIATGLITLLGVPLAYALAHGRGRVAAATGVLVQLPLALPPVMSGIVLVYLVGPYTALGRLFHGALTDSLTGVVLAQSFVSAPFLVIAAREAFAGIDPALDDLAATLGHRPLDRFARVSLRVAAPSIAAGMLLTWLRALGEYGATVLLAYHPYSLPVFTYVQFSSTGIPATQAPTAIALGLAVLLVLATALRRPRRHRHAHRLPAPRPPRELPATTVAFDLDWRVGGFRLEVAHAATSPRIAVLGRSGSGKSMTLRALAGLYGADAGTVRYSGEDVTGLPAERRPIGYVPQGAALFPGRTAWQQVTSGVDADPAVAAWWLRTLGLDGLADRLPDQLSGGQRQRVSLAQALSRGPALVLLDEPFSALDAPVRAELRAELRRLQRENGLSTVLVTHDPEEAALLADEILVLDSGRLLQAGPRREVFTRPATPAVAALLGFGPVQAATVLSAEAIDADGVVVGALPGDLPPGSPVLWSVRPDRVRLADDGPYEATVLDIADLGATATVTVGLVSTDVRLAARVLDADGLEAGDKCQVAIAPADVITWPAPCPTAVRSRGDGGGCVGAGIPGAARVRS